MTYATVFENEYGLRGKKDPRELKSTKLGLKVRKKKKRSSKSAHTLIPKTGAKMVQSDKNMLCSRRYPILVLTHLCHSLSSLRHINFSLPFGSVSPFFVPLWSIFSGLLPHICLMEGSF